MLLSVLGMLVVGTTVVGSVVATGGCCVSGVGRVVATNDVVARCA